MSDNLFSEPHYQIMKRGVHTGRAPRFLFCASVLTVAATSVAGGCAADLAYRPQQPVRGAGSGVTAEVRDVVLGDEGGVVTLSVAAPGGALLTDVTLSRLPAVPCTAAAAGVTGTDWVGVTVVVVDGQEVYRAGPADVSGSSHEVTLSVVAPDKLWRREQLAVDLKLTLPALSAGTPGCVRLAFTGIEGADWVGKR